MLRLRSAIALVALAALAVAQPVAAEGKSTPKAVTCKAGQVGAEGFVGTTLPAGLYFSLYLQDAHPSTDGKSYSGSEEQTQAGSGLKLSWAPTGTE